MGMSIEEAIDTIKGNRWIACSEKYQEAMNLIETTISKYQKIEQIINYPVYIQEDVLRYKMICEVVGKKNITHGTYEGENGWKKM